MEATTRIKAVTQVLIKTGLKTPGLPLETFLRMATSQIIHGSTTTFLCLQTTLKKEKTSSERKEVRPRITTTKVVLTKAIATPHSISHQATLKK